MSDVRVIEAGAISLTSVSAFSVREGRGCGGEGTPRGLRGRWVTGVPNGEDMGATGGKMLAALLRSADSRVGMKFAETTRSACNAASMREMSDSGT